MSKWIIVTCFEWFPVCMHTYVPENCVSLLHDFSFVWADWHPAQKIQAAEPQPNQPAVSCVCVCVCVSNPQRAFCSVEAWRTAFILSNDFSYEVKDSFRTGNLLNRLLSARPTRTSRSLNLSHPQERSLQWNPRPGVQSHPLADRWGFLWHKVRRWKSRLTCPALRRANAIKVWDEMWIMTLLSLETSTRMATGRSRRSASRSSWWSWPISGPRRCTWPRSSVTQSGGRSCDVCVSESRHMLAIISLVAV